jgi:hypothetical protein
VYWLKESCLGKAVDVLTGQVVSGETKSSGLSVGLGTHSHTAVMRGEKGAGSLVMPLEIRCVS